MATKNLLDTEAVDYEFIDEIKDLERILTKAQATPLKKGNGQSPKSRLSSDVFDIAQAEGEKEGLEDKIRNLTTRLDEKNDIITRLERQNNDLYMENRELRLNNEKLSDEVKYLRDYCDDLIRLRDDLICQKDRYDYSIQQLDYLREKVDKIEMEQSSLAMNSFLHPSVTNLVTNKEREAISYNKKEEKINETSQYFQPLISLDNEKIDNKSDKYPDNTRLINIEKPKKIIKSQLQNITTIKNSNVRKMSEIIPVPKENEIYVLDPKFQHVLFEVKQYSEINYISLHKISENDNQISVVIDAPNKENAKLARNLVLTHFNQQIKLEKAEARLEKVQNSLFSAQGEVASGLMVDFAINPEFLGYIIGKKGSRIKKIQDESKVSSIDISSKTGRIMISGPTSTSVQQAREMLEVIEDFLPLEPKYYNWLNLKDHSKILIDMREVTELMVCRLDKTDRGIKIIGIVSAVMSARFVLSTQLDYIDKQIELEGAEQMARERLYSYRRMGGDRGTRINEKTKNNKITRNKSTEIKPVNQENKTTVPKIEETRNFDDTVVLSYSENTPKQILSTKSRRNQKKKGEKESKNEAILAANINKMKEHSVEGNVKNPVKRQNSGSLQLITLRESVKNLSFDDKK